VQKSGADALPFNPFQDYQNYDVRTHHTNLDARDHVKPEDIRQSAIVIASFARQAAMLESPRARARQRYQRLPRK
jgi:hypothetical protein